MHVKNWCVKDLLFCVAVAFGVSACGGVGDGNKPETIDVLAAGSSVGDTEANAYLCLPQLMILRIEFTNGDVANYASRATWTSSNPEVLEVSNGDIPIPDLTDANGEPVYYAIGAALPRAPGTATVTAHYLDLDASISLRVSDIAELALSPLDQRVAPGTFQGYTLTAQTGEVTSNVGTSATFSFAEPNDDVATISETSGTVTAIASGGPLTVVASLPLCGRELSTTMTVTPAVALEMTHETGFTGSLVKDTTEAFTVMADFGDGPEQDVSAQAIFASSNTDFASFASSRRILEGLSAGDVTVSARIGTTDSDTTDDEVPEQPRIDSNSIPVSVVDATLNAIAISPRDVTIRSGTTQQFKATGSYNGGALSQDITRHVAWSVSDTSIARIVTGLSLSAGLLTSIVNDPGVVDVQAEEEDATDKSTDKTTVTFDPDAPAP